MQKVSILIYFSLSSYLGESLLSLSLSLAQRMFKTALDKACSHKIIAFAQALQGLINPTLALKIIIFGEFDEIFKNNTNGWQQ